MRCPMYYDFVGEPNPLYEEVTGRGTERLLRRLRESEVGQFIFLSTMPVVMLRIAGASDDDCHSIPIGNRTPGRAEAVG